MAEIVISEFMDAAAVASLSADHRVLFDPDLHARPADLEAAVADARALIVRNRTQVRAAVLDVAPRLEVVGRLGVGLDNIDLDACRARGIEVCPATGANTVAVVEYVVAAMLVLSRGAFGAGVAMAAGRWPRERLVGHELHGRCLGLVGLGAIARALADQARALGLEIAAFDPYLARHDPAWSGVVCHDELGSLLAAADILSLHVPLTPSTRGLIGAAALARMRPGAILINTARGGVVDEAALADSLRAGHLGGAALDVFAQEPLGGADAARFADLPNIILTPHIAGVTHESNARVSALTAANVRRVLERGGP